MGRKTFESRKDTDVETLIADRLGVMWNTVLHKTPKFYPFDFTADARDGSGTVTAIIEVKRRYINLSSIEEPFISAHKVMELSKYGEAFGVRALIVFAFNDTMCYCDVAHLLESGVRIVHGGRTVKTRDDQDTEPMVMIPRRVLIEMVSDINKEWYEQ